VVKRDTSSGLKTKEGKIKEGSLIEQCRKDDGVKIAVSGGTGGERQNNLLTG